MKRSMGKVYLIGAGPGDPGLITVKGLECVKRADVVIYDYLANEHLLDQGRPDAEYIYVGKQSGKHTLPQDQINALIIHKAREGNIVVRLKGGDPFIFGRGGEEAEELADSNIPFEIIPGVSAALAVPAYAGIPLTHRDHNASVAFVTGHENPEKTGSKVHWDKIATGIGTIVIFMGAKNLPGIITHLIKNGRSSETPVAVIQWGTRTDQKVVTGVLGDIVEKVKETELGPPAIIVVGEVVKLREKLNWYEPKPLFGKRIVVTRSREQTDVFSEELTELGATVIEFPTIGFVPAPDHRGLDTVLHTIETYDWIIFTSPHAVRYFMARLRGLGNDSRMLKGVKICSFGKKTMDTLDHFGLKPDLIPAQTGVEGLLTALGGMNISGLKLLIPQASEARELIPDKLREFGAEVTVAPAYEIIKPVADVARIDKLFAEKKIALVTFTSPSSVRNFVEMLGLNKYKSLTQNVITACIGPVTAQTVEEYGMKVGILPKESTIPALVHAMTDYFQKK